MVGARSRSSSSTATAKHTAEKKKKAKTQEDAVEHATRLVTTQKPAVVIDAKETQFTVASARELYEKARRALENALKKEAVDRVNKTVKRTKAVCNIIHAKFVALDHTKCHIALANSYGPVLTLALQPDAPPFAWSRAMQRTTEKINMVKRFLSPTCSPPTPEEVDYIYEYLKFMTWMFVRAIHNNLQAEGIQVVPLSDIRRALDFE